MRMMITFGPKDTQSCHGDTKDSDLLIKQAISLVQSENRIQVNEEVVKSNGRSYIWLEFSHIK